MTWGDAVKLIFKNSNIVLRSPTTQQPCGITWTHEWHAICDKRCFINFHVCKCDTLHIRHKSNEKVSEINYSVTKAETEHVRCLSIHPCVWCTTQLSCRRIRDFLIEMSLGPCSRVGNFPLAVEIIITNETRYGNKRVDDDIVDVLCIFFFHVEIFKLKLSTRISGKFNNGEHISMRYCIFSHFLERKKLLSPSSGPGPGSI